LRIEIWDLRIGNYKTILLKGGRGVGKTTVCQAVAELARRRGYRPGGVITPALYACPEPFDFTQDRRSRRACPEPFDFTQDRQSPRACSADWELTKVGFEAVDVGSGERWPLAHADQDLGGPRVGPYSFDPAGLARALRVLERAISTRCDLLMVDEIGPLELEQGEGFAPILDLLPVEGPTHTLIVVRSALLDPLRLHLCETVRLSSPEPSSATSFKVFSVTEGNREEMPLRIVEELWGDG
jgi:nucleoside-triphosphatase THEP1